MGWKFGGGWCREGDEGSGSGSGSGFRASFGGSEVDGLGRGEGRSEGGAEGGIEDMLRLWWGSCCYIIKILVVEERRGFSYVI